MSRHIVIHSWSGADPENATAKLAQVFRLDREEAAGIVEGLTDGNAWQFPRPISEQQSQVAQNFLTSAGFEVECRDPMSDDGMELVTDEPETAETSSQRAVPAGEVQYVGFWVRFAAYLIDSALLSVLIFPIYMVIMGMVIAGMGTEPTDASAAGGLGLGVAASYLLLILFMVLYYILFWKKKGATPGKMIFKAIIVNADTFKPLSTGQCVVRLIGYMVGSILLFLPFLLVAFTGRKQGLHDLMAKTVVIKAPR